MKINWTKYMVAALGAGAWLGNAETAHAAQVCWVQYSPQTATTGSFGSFTVGMAAGVGTCSVTNNYAFCSTGATNVNCDLAYLYREAALFAMYAALLEAKTNGADVSVSGTFVGPGPYYKGKYFTVNQ